MLPSRAVRALCQEAFVAVIRSTDPACAQLATEFRVPAEVSSVVVLDGKGEMLGRWMADDAGACCGGRLGGQFPARLVALVRRDLRRRETVEALERRWLENPRDRAALEQLAERLAEMHALDRLAQLCDQSAGNARLSRRLRAALRIRAFVAHACYLAGNVAPRSRARIIREGEKLLVELAAHPDAPDLVGVLFSAGYAQAFDVPARTAQGIARLEKAARQARQSGPLRQHIRRLGQIRGEWMEDTRAFLGQLDDPVAHDYLAARLGDARAAVRLFSRPPFRESAGYRAQLREAQAKLARERR